jgi:hypothetical protein
MGIVAKLEHRFFHYSLQQKLHTKKSEASTSTYVTLAEDKQR